jgi:hypothetical protein
MRSSIRFTPGLLSRLDRGGPNPKSTLEAGSLPSARRANKHGLEVLAATIWASVALSGYAQSQLFTCTTNNGTITITGYLGTNVVVAIPATINGLPVTSIEGTRSFPNAYNSAFGTFPYNNVTSVALPNSVTNIGDGAFYDCQSLTNVALPNSLTSISEAAFSLCGSLPRIELPSSLVSIGAGAFSLCSKLENIAIPEGVTNLGAGAFDASGLATVTIPSSVTRINEGTFANCSSLSSVTLPQSLVSLGVASFMSCGLTNITLPPGVVSVGIQAFLGCRGLTNIIGVLYVQRSDGSNPARQPP